MQGNTTPPELPGYTYLRTLGGGSTSIVYLYRQHAPERDVAVKVNTSPLDEHARARFRAEADRMARLSSHPYILSVYGAGVTPDGFDYIVFEYAPGGTYKPLMQTRRLDVDQTLDLGIKLASALYTAHRAGIVHRDIKPSNVLITAAGQPALADFGVAATIYQSNVSTGHSPAWAAPEVLTEASGGGVASDIYSLGATLFAMLAGRSPFEYGYPVTSRRQLVRAIVNEPLPALARPDVPPQVEQALRKAMAKDPESRYYTALDFARTLQNVQMSLFGHATPVVAPDMPAYPRNLQRRRRRTAAERGGAHGGAWVRPVAIIAGVAVVVAAVAAVFALVVFPRTDSAELDHRVSVADSPSGQTAGEDAGALQGAGMVPSPEHLQGSFDGDDVTFTWINPAPKEGDSYAWTIVDGDAADQRIGASATDDTTVTIDDVDEPQICLSVSIVREDRSMSQEPAIACAVR